jgi:hypothetical protein
VHFVTPKLELQDISETRLKEASYRECFLTLRDRVPRTAGGDADETNPKPVGARKPRPWYWRIVTRQWHFSNSAKRANALFQSGDILDSCLTHDFDNRIINMERRSTLSVMCSDEEQVNSPLVKHRFVSDQRVSWLPFLRHLYRAQNRTASADSTSSSQPPPVPGPDPWASLLERPECAKLDLLKSTHPTGVSVSFVKWTWDSLPSKATRPMATTTLGTLVVMATRLGMQWSIDLEKDSYQASGNGYSLSCTQVPEMGLVATFTAEERDHRRAPHALAFNDLTDKFMCGIIPGARFLVDKDFHCTDDSGHTDVLKAVFNAIDLPDRFHQRLNRQLAESSDKSRTYWKNMLSNEITVLLGELLPYEGADDHIFSGWKEDTGGVAMCPFSSPQLFQQFPSYIRSHRSLGPAASDVCRQMSNLADLAAAGENERAMQYTRRILERTTLWFVSHGFDQRYYRQKLYLHLIAAHCYLSLRAWEGSPGGSSSALNRDFPTSEVDSDRLAHCYFAEANKPDLEKRQKRKGGLDVYLVDVNLHMVRLPDGYDSVSSLFHDAWFVLMLRVIAWFSLKNMEEKATTVRSRGAIPSSCWDNQRPVWII